MESAELDEDLVHLRDQLDQLSSLYNRAREQQTFSQMAPHGPAHAATRVVELLRYRDDVKMPWHQPRIFGAEEGVIFSFQEQQ